MKGLRISAVLLVVISAFVLTANLKANSSLAPTETIANWTGGTGNWSSSANWDCPTALTHCVPSNTSSVFYNVQIDSLTTASTVTLDQNANVDALSIGTDTSSTAPAQVLNIGLSGAPKSLTVGSANADGFFHEEANGTVNIAGGSTLQFNEAAGDFANYDIDGVINVGTAGGSGGTIVLNGTGLAANGNDSAFAFSSDNLDSKGNPTGTVVLNGSSVIKGATGTEYFNNNLTIEGEGSINGLWMGNYGTLKSNVSGGTLTIQPAAYVFNNGNFVSGGFYNYGEIDVSAGSTLTIVSNTGGGYLSGFGSLFQGDLSQGGTYNLSGVFNYGGGSANTINTIDGGVSVALNGPGALMTPDGTTNGIATLTTLNGSLTLTNGATVGGTLSSLTLGSQGSLEVDGNTVLITQSLGAPDLSAGTLAQGNYTIGGTFQYGGGSGNVVKTIGQSASVTLIGAGGWQHTNANNQTVTSPGGAALMTPDGTTNAFAGLTTNNGILTLAGGGAANLVLGTFTNNGYLDVEENTQLTTADLTNLQSGALVSGRFEVGGTYVYGGGSGNTIQTIGQGALVKLDGDAGGVALMTPDGTTNGLASLQTVNGELDVDNGAVLNTGSNPLANNGTVSLDGNGKLTVGSLTNLGSNGVLSGGTYFVGGVFQYGGSTTVTTIASNTSVTLDGDDGPTSIMTPNGTTNAFSTLASNQGILQLFDGAGVGGALASLNNTGSLSLASDTEATTATTLKVFGNLTSTSNAQFSQGTVELDNSGNKLAENTVYGPGNTLTVGGNYEQADTVLGGPENFVNVGGTFTNGNFVEVDKGSAISVTQGLTNVNSSNVLTSADFDLEGGTFFYNGAGITTIAGGSQVTLDLAGAAGLATDADGNTVLFSNDGGTSSALDALAVNNGQLTLGGVNQTFRSGLSGTGSLNVGSSQDANGNNVGGTAVSKGNYAQFGTRVFGQGSTLSVTGSFTVAKNSFTTAGSVFVSDGGAINATGQLTNVDSGGNLTAASIELDGGTFFYNGTGITTIGSGSEVTLSLDGAAGLTTDADGNTVLFSDNGGTSSALDALAVNNGQLSLDGVNQTFQSGLSGTGSLSVGSSQDANGNNVPGVVVSKGNYAQGQTNVLGQGSTLTVNGTFTAAGASGEPGEVFEQDGGAISATGALTNVDSSGNLTAASIDLDGGTFFYHGTGITTIGQNAAVTLDRGSAGILPTDADGNTVLFSNNGGTSSALDALAVNNGQLALGGVNQTFQSGLSGTGSLTVQSDLNFSTPIPGVVVSNGNYAQGQTDVSGAGSTLTVNGTFTAAGVSGQSGTVGAQQGGAITATGAFTNVDSSGNLTEASVQLNGGTFFYTGTGVQSIANSSSVTLSAVGLTGVKTDGGGSTVLFSNDGGTTSALDALASSEGSLEFDGGVTQRVVSLTNGGFGNGGVVALTSNNADNTGNTLDVAGNYEQEITDLVGSGNTMAVTGNFSNDSEVEVDAGSSLTVGGTFENLQSGTLQGICSATITDDCGFPSFTVGGTFNYGGGKTNLITTIGSTTNGGASVTMIGPGALMTPDGTTNGLSALNTINSGSALSLQNGAGVGGTLASLTNAGNLSLADLNGLAGTTLTITGNLVDSVAAAGTSGSVDLETFSNFINGQEVFGPGNTLTVGGNYAQEVTSLNGAGNAISVAGSFTNGDQVTVDAGSSVNVAGALTNVDSSGNLDPANSNQHLYDLEGGTFFYHGNNIVTNNSQIELNAAGATGLKTDANGSTILLSADGGKTSALDTLTTNNSVFDLEGGVTQKFTNAVTNASILELQNAGNLVQTPGFSNTGVGSVEVDNGSQLDVTGAAGSFTNVASNTLSDGSYTIGGTLAYTGDGINTIAAGTSLTLNGANWQINNNYRGSASNALANFSTNNGGFDMANGATLSVSGGVTNAASAVMDVGSFNGTGFVANSVSSLAINGALNNQGSFEAGNIFDSPGSTFDGVGSVTAAGLTNGASASFEVDPGSSFTVTGANGGSFTNLSAGTLSGGTYTIGGLFQYNGGSSNTIQTIAANTNLTLENGYNITPDGTTNGIATLQTNNGTLNVGEYGGSDLKATFATDGAVTNNGALNVTGNQASMTTGGNLTNSGTVTVDNFSGASLTAQGDFDNQSGGTVNVGTSSDTGTVTVTGAFNNAGTLSLDNCNFGCSTPTVTVTAANGFNNSGVLEGEGTLVANVTNSGVVTPGGASASSPGVINITGGYTQTSAGTLNELITGTTAGQFSVMNATGKVSLAGTLSVNALNGFTFAQGNSFDLFNFPAGDLAGTFGTLQYGSASSTNGTLNLGNGLELQLAYNNSNVLLNVISAVAPTQDNWIGTTDNWNTPANYATDWSTGAIPTSSQNVTVGTGAGGTVTYNDANDTIASLTVQKGTSSNYVLTFAAGNTLNATNGVTINSGGEIDVETSGAALTTSTLANNGGTVEVGGSGGGTVTVAGLSNGGTIGVNTGGTLSLNGVGTYDNASGGTITMAGGTISGATGSEFLTSEGTISGDGTLSNLTLLNTGTISPSGTLTITPSSSGYFENNGGITLESGDSLAVSGSNGNTFVGGSANNTGGGVTVNGGTWTNAGFVQVGGNTGTSSVLIENGGKGSEGSAGDGLDVGFASGSTGSLTVDGSGSTWTDTAGGMQIGDSGKGTVDLESGGAASTEFAVVGGNGTSTGSGTLTVFGGSKFNDSGYLIVGNSGNGVMNVSIDNSTVTVGNDWELGVNPGVTGTATINGGTVNVTGFVLVGGSDPSKAGGSGTILVEGGSTVTATGVLYVAEGAGSTGSVTVTGAGTKWTNSGDEAIVGETGAGTLDIEDGAVFSSVAGSSGTGSAGYLGNGANASGTVTVDGTASEWNLKGGGMVVGGTGLASSLTISNGGLVSGGTGTVGFDTTAANVATVESGGKWTMTGNLNVGGNTLDSITGVGNGTLNVDALGMVTDANAVVGFNAGSTGAVTVNGAGSKWNNSGSLTVSSNGGVGTVAIQDGGSVTAASVSNSGIISTGNASSDTGSNSLAVTGAFANNSGATLQMESNNDSATVGSFTNAGSVSLASVTNLTVNSGGSYTQASGTTTVNGTLASPTVEINGGTLNGSGKITGAVTIGSSGTIQAGDAPGTMNFAGSLAINGALNEAIDSASSFDALNITGAPGTLTLGSGSTLNIQLAANYTPGAGQTFTIATSSGLSGTFSSVLNDTFNSGLEQWDVSYANNDVVLTAANVSATLVTATWNTATGNWTTAAEWSCTPGTNCVPNNGAPANTNYAAVINSSVTNTLTLSTAETVNTLTLTSGTLDIASGGSLNLAAQPGGITDIPAAAGLFVEGGFTTGSNSALAGLTTVEGKLVLGNGQATSITPGGTPATLTVNGRGANLAVFSASTTLTVNGNLANTNSGTVSVGESGALNVTGALTNDSTSLVETDGGSAASITASTYDTAGTTNVGSDGSFTVANLYDQSGSAAQTLDDGTITTYAYDMAGGTTVVESGASLNVTSGTPNSNNLYDQTAGTTTVDGKLTTYDYDAAGGNTTVGTGGTLATQNLYDQTGSATVTTDEGTITTYAYDMGGGTTDVESGGTLNVTSATPNSNNLYDQTAGTTNVTGRLNTYAYDAAGSSATSVQSGGNITTSTYDALDNSVTTIEGNGTLTTTTLYDAEGSQTTTIDPLGTMTTYAYDQAGGTTNVNGTLNVTSTSPNSNNLYDQTAGTTNVAGTLNTYAYDAAGSSATNVQSGGNITTSTYDALDNSVTTIEGNGTLTTTTLYDAEGSQTTTIDPLGTMTTYAYDNAGGTTNVNVNGTLNVTSATPNSNNLYDQTAGTTNVAGTLTTYAYDNAGGTTEVTNGGNLTANQYNQTGSTANTTVNSGGTLNATTSYDQSAGTTDVDGTLITTYTQTGGLLSGTGTVAGTVYINGGTIDPGDQPAAGTLTVRNYVPGAAGTLTIDINGGSAGDFGVLNVTDVAFLNGTLDISLNPGFLPTNNETFLILDAGDPLDGLAFASITNGTFGSNGTWNVIYGENTVTLQAHISQTHVTPEPASLLLFGTGLIGLALVLRRKKRLTA